MGTVTSVLTRDGEAPETQEAAWERYEAHLSHVALEQRGEVLCQYHPLDLAPSALSSHITREADLIPKAKTLRIACNWLVALDPLLLPHAAKLAHITSLDAQNNPLSSAKPHTALAKFKSLTSLRLSRTSLTELPNEISELISLTELHVEENSLLKFPTVVYSLPNLRHLDLGHNSMPTVPEGLGALSKLRYLNLAHNNLWEDAFPSSLSDLSELTTLHVDHNPVLAMPEALPRLTSLTSLSLSQTKVIKNSDELKCLNVLTNLEALSLAHLSLTSFPDLSPFVKLRSVDLSFNKIDSVPSRAVAGLKNLTKVSLLANNLRGLPSALMELPSLRVLALRGLTLEAPNGSKVPSLKLIGSVEALRSLSDPMGFSAALDKDEDRFLAISTAPLAIDKGAVTAALARPNLGVTAGSQAIPEKASKLTRAELVDRILGVVFGTALGDAVGLSSEFMTRETALFYYDSPLVLGNVIRDRHRGMWIPGDWTDDTDQMLLLLDNLLDHEGKADAKAYAASLHNWMNHGIQSHGDHGCSGLGQNTYSVLSHPHFLDDPIRASLDVWERSGKKSAANGAVMRTGIVGVPYFWTLETVLDNAKVFAKVTHSDPRCAASAVAVTSAIALMLQGGEEWTAEGLDSLIKRSLEMALKELDTPTTPTDHKTDLIASLHCTRLRELALDDGSAIGYTYKALGAGFWALRQSSFEGMMTALTFEAGDADTNGAVAGAMLGCKLGYSQLPQHWLKHLAHHDWLMAKAYALLDAMGL